MYEADSTAVATIESSGEFASCMTSADYDADGYLDLITDSPEVKTVANDHYGAVYAFLGPLSGTLDADDAYATWQSAGGAGKTLTTGDFDADGNVDIAMGNAYGEYFQGFVFVQFGLVSGVILDDAALLSIPGTTYEYHGTSLATVGDWTGDLGDELVIGASSLGATGLWGAGGNGGAYVVFSDEFTP